MFGSVSQIRKGQTISAAWLSKVGKMLTAQDAAPGFGAVATQAFKANIQSRGETFAMLLAVEDVLDDITADGSALAKSIKNANAVKLVWSEEVQDYQSTGIHARIRTIFGVPLPKNTKLMCRYDVSAGCWIPTRERETEVLRILSSTPDGDGFYDAVVVRWNSDTWEWLETDPAWVIDANPDATAAPAAAGLADGDYGMVTVSGGGTIITIKPGVVTPLMLDPAGGDTGSY